VRVLVTGATGLIGSETMRALRARGAGQVVGVARHAARDVVAWDIGTQPAPPELRHGRWDAIAHAAASTRWTMTPNDAVQANVATVRALQAVAMPTTRLVHVSTAFALGRRGDVTSPALSDFRNTYEWSKASAERCARELFQEVAIVRPPLTIGRRADGRAVRFAGLYLLLRGIASSMIPAVVGDEQAFFDVVPADDVATRIADLVLDASLPRQRVVTVAGGSAALRVGTALELIVATLNAWRTERGIPAIPPPPLLSPERWERFFRPFVAARLSPRQLRVLHVLSNFEPYLAITEPLRPTHQITDVEPCLAASVRFWAHANPRIAVLPPAPWQIR
jgi:nucleoside-diphosphate-sugar epimerase